MPVRIDDDDLMDSGRTDSDHASRSRGWVKPVLMLGVPMMILVVALIAVLAGKGPATPGAGAVPQETVPPSTSASPSPAPPVEPAELPQSDIPVGGDMASNTLGPMFIGYDQTEEGAVAAALNYNVAQCGPDVFDDQTRHRVDDYAYATEAVRKQNAVPDGVAAKARQKHGLDQHGIPVDPSEKVYSDVYPEYGAFQIVGTRGNTEVTVMMWAPQVFGVGTTTRDVTISWSYWKFKMVWIDGDWRIAERLETPTPPAPKKAGTAWVSFQERGQLLGKGWELVANASEEPIDRLELPEA